MIVMSRTQFTRQLFVKKEYFSVGNYQIAFSIIPLLNSGFLKSFHRSVWNGRTEIEITLIKDFVAFRKLDLSIISKKFQALLNNIKNRFRLKEDNIFQSNLNE